jgi:hypothetical protein
MESQEREEGMKVWVCRDVGGSYAIYRVENNPILKDGYWFCNSRSKSILLDWDRPANKFKALTGIKKHLKPGTKRLMEWRLPLAGEG